MPTDWTSTGFSTLSATVGSDAIALRPMKAAEPPDAAACRDLLDATLDRLDPDAVVLAGEFAAPAVVRDPVRAQAARQAAAADVPAWLGPRWLRWSAAFGLPRPPEGVALTEDALLRPAAAAARVHRRLAPYLGGVVALLDAALAVAPGVTLPSADAAVLLRGWSAACLPAAVGGLHAVADAEIDAAVDALLHRAAALDPVARERVRAARAAVAPADWAAARAAVEDTATACGLPFLARGLSGSARAVAEDGLLADAAWGAAVDLVFADRLPPQVRARLTAPLRAA